MCDMVINTTLKFTKQTWHAGFFKRMMKNIKNLLEKKQLKMNLDLEELQILIEQLS